MRILIISKFFPPENSIASLRPYSWAKFWSRSGHDVSVLTTVKPSGKAEALKFSNKESFKLFEIDYQQLYYKVQKIYLGNVKINDSSPSPDHITHIPKNNKEQKNGVKAFIKNNLKNINQFRLKRGFLSGQRMPDTMDLWIKPALNWARENGPWDLIVSSHAPYASHIIAYKLKKEFLTKYWIADFRDLWTDHHIFKGLFPFTWVEKYLERQILAETNVITTVSEPLANTIRKKNINRKIEVIENGFDIEDLEGLPSEPIFRDNKIRIVYTGTIYKGKQNPKLLFDAVSELAQNPEQKYLLNNLEILFIGATNSIPLTQAKEAGVSDWVKDGGFLSREEVLRIQRDAHALLFLEFDKGNVKGILTGKLYEYLFSGTEIWAIDVFNDSSTGEIITKANAGILFGDNQPFLLQELVRLLTQGQKISPELNKKYIEKYSRKVLAEKMLDVISMYKMKTNK